MNQNITNIQNKTNILKNRQHCTNFQSNQVPNHWNRVHFLICKSIKWIKQRYLKVIGRDVLLSLGYLYLSAGEALGFYGPLDLLIMSSQSISACNSNHEVVLSPRGRSSLNRIASLVIQSHDPFWVLGAGPVVRLKSILF